MLLIPFFKTPLSLTISDKLNLGENEIALIDSVQLSNTPKPQYNEPWYSEFHNIVNKTQLPFWGFTRHITFDIVNKKGLTDLFVISRFEIVVRVKKLRWGNFVPPTLSPCIVLTTNHSWIFVVEIVFHWGTKMRWGT